MPRNQTEFDYNANNGFDLATAITPPAVTTVSEVANNGAARPEVDALGIIVHKNQAPDSYLVQFMDEKVMSQGQNQTLNVDRVRNIATMVIILSPATITGNKVVVKISGGIHAIGSGFNRPSLLAS